MKKTILILTSLLPLAAQSNELGLLLGNLRGGGTPELGSGTALQANYAHRIADLGPARLYFGVNLLANTQRKVTSANLAVIRDVASLYLTPELKLKLATGRIQPYVFAGAGYAAYEHSTLTLGGANNPGPRNSSTGSFTYGGGVDIPIIRWLALRGELRDNFTGAPKFNVDTAKKLHNASFSGGFVLRWGS